MHRMIALALALAAAVVGCGDHDGSRQEPSGEALTNPQSPEMNQQAPAQYQVRMETSAGPIVIEAASSAWSAASWSSGACTAIPR